MQTGQVTSGLYPLVIGSAETFQLAVDLNGLPHALTGGSATLKLADPNGNVTTIAATISGGDAFANWMVVGPGGSWTRAWTWTDSAGLTQVSLAVPFVVTNAP